MTGAGYSSRLIATNRGRDADGDARRKSSSQRWTMRSTSTDGIDHSAQDEDGARGAKNLFERGVVLDADQGGL